MAKKSMINKQQRTPKYSTRAYTRCSICGRPHAVLRKYGICRICFRNLAYKGQIHPGREKGELVRRHIMTDPIADMLTRIRNAITAKHETVEVPASNMKKAIANILLEEGYIKNVKFEDDGLSGKIVIDLKYADGKSVISGLKRVSKPGLRTYSGAERMPRVLGGLGTAIVSTSKGIMTDKQAKAANVGGEVLCFVW